MPLSTIRIAVIAASLAPFIGCTPRAVKPTPQSAEAADATRLVHEFVATWRLEMRAVALGRMSPLNAKSVVNAGQYTLRGVPDSISAFQDMRAVCMNGESLERGGAYHAWFPRSMQALYPQIRTPRHDLTGYCPYWGPASPGHATYVQEAETYFTASALERVAAQRKVLLDSLHHLAERAPTDTVVLAELVRFSADAGVVQRSRHAVERCSRIGLLFCQRLDAVLSDARGERSIADSLFAIAARAQACDKDIALLVMWRPDTDMRCGHRDVSDSVFWWLADPLWSTPRNERRVEHERRRAESLLRAVVGRDEVMDYTSENQASAHAVMMRYGVPSSYRYYPRTDNPKSDPWFYGPTTDRLRPNGALNYSMDRIAVVPTEAVLRAPTRSTVDDWTPSEPKPLRFMNPWPYEHMRTPLRLKTTRHVQTVRFRRDSAQLIAVAARPEFVGGARSAAIWMPSPSMEVRVPLEGHQAALLRTPRRGGVLSIESVTDSYSAQRARTGVPALEDSGATLSVSDVALTLGGAPHTGLAETLPLSRLRPSTDIRRPDGVAGLFWEVYGAAPSDTLTVSMDIRAVDRGGALTWLQNFVSVGAARVRGQSIEWTVPPPSGDARIVRSVSTDLNLQNVPTGRYTLTIGVRVGTRQARSAVREFAVVDLQ